MVRIFTIFFTMRKQLYEENWRRWIFLTTFWNYDDYKSSSYTYMKWYTNHNSSFPRTILKLCVGRCKIFVCSDMLWFLWFYYIVFTCISWTLRCFMYILVPMWLISEHFLLFSTRIVYSLYFASCVTYKNYDEFHPFINHNLIKPS